MQWTMREDSTFLGAHQDNCTIAKVMPDWTNVLYFKEEACDLVSSWCLGANDRKMNSRVTGWRRIVPGLNCLYMACLSLAYPREGTELNLQVKDLQNLQFSRVVHVLAFIISRRVFPDRLITGILRPLVAPTNWVLINLLHSLLPYWAPSWRFLWLLNLFLHMSPLSSTRCWPYCVNRNYSSTLDTLRAQWWLIVIDNEHRSFTYGNWIWSCPTWLEAMLLEIL